MFREEALEHHYRDPQSMGVIDTLPRWTWPIIAISVLLVAGAVAYFWLIPADLNEALRERLLR